MRIQISFSFSSELLAKNTAQVEKGRAIRKQKKKEKEIIKETIKKELEEKSQGLDNETKIGTNFYPTGYNTELGGYGGQSESVGFCWIKDAGNVFYVGNRNGNFTSATTLLTNYNAAEGSNQIPNSGWSYSEYSQFYSDINFGFPNEINYGWTGSIWDNNGLLQRIVSGSDNPSNPLNTNHYYGYAVSREFSTSGGDRKLTYAVVPINTDDCLVITYEYWHRYWGWLWIIEYGKWYRYSAESISYQGEFANLVAKFNSTITPPDPPLVTILCSENNPGMLNTGDGFYYIALGQAPYAYAQYGGGRWDDWLWEVKTSAASGPNLPGVITCSGGVSSVSGGQKLITTDTVDIYGNRRVNSAESWDTCGYSYSQAFSYLIGVDYYHADQFYQYYNVLPGGIGQDMASGSQAKAFHVTKNSVKDVTGSLGGFLDNYVKKRFGKPKFTTTEVYRLVLQNRHGFDEVQTVLTTYFDVPANAYPRPTLGTISSLGNTVDDWVVYGKDVEIEQEVPSNFPNGMSGVYANVGIDARDPAVPKSGDNGNTSTPDDYKQALGRGFPAEPNQLNPTTTTIYTGSLKTLETQTSFFTPMEYYYYNNYNPGQGLEANVEAFRKAFGAPLVDYRANRNKDNIFEGGIWGLAGTQFYSPNGIYQAAVKARTANGSPEYSGTGELLPGFARVRLSSKATYDKTVKGKMKNKTMFGLLNKNGPSPSTYGNWQLVMWSDWNGAAIIKNSLVSYGIWNTLYPPT